MATKTETQKIDAESLKVYSKIKLADSMDALTKQFKEYVREGRKLESAFNTMTKELIRLNGGVPLPKQAEDLAGEDNH